jgi:regulatory protein
VPRQTAPPDPLARAKAFALRLLAVRTRTEAQIRARLARAELSRHAAEVVAWLRGLGYLDDDAYARAQARAMLAPGKLGPRKAERRLIEAGLSPAEARAAVRRALEGEEGRPFADAERELCRVLAERRAGGPLGELDDRSRARLARFLAGRGFGGSAVASVLGIFEDGEG